MPLPIFAQHLPIHRSKGARGISGEPTCNAARYLGQTSLTQSGFVREDLTELWLLSNNLTHGEFLPHT